MGTSLSLPGRPDHGLCSVDYNLASKSDNRKAESSGNRVELNNKNRSKQKLFNSPLSKLSLTTATTVSTTTNGLPQLEASLTRSSSLLRAFNWKRFTAGRTKKSAAAATSVQKAPIDPLDRNKNFSKTALTLCNRVQCCRTASHRLDVIDTSSARTIAEKGKQKHGLKSSSPLPLPPPRAVLVVSTEQKDKKAIFQNRCISQQTTSSSSTLTPVPANESFSGISRIDHHGEGSSTKTSINDSGPIPVDLVPPKRTVIQASTSELLKCLGVFLKQKTPNLPNFQPADAILWLRTVDRTLLLQGWQDIAFINPANTVFLYMLLKEMIPSSVQTEKEIHSIVLNCLYMAYSYMGSEISYPVKPFMVVGVSREQFWQRCIQMMNRCSFLMLQINSDPKLFTQLFTELKALGEDQ